VRDAKVATARNATDRPSSAASEGQVWPRPEHSLVPTKQDTSTQPGRLQIAPILQPRILH
jgi:hypothetical protein